MFDDNAQQPHTPATPPATPHASPRTFDELLRAHDLRFFRGDLHNHTSYSDGTGTPAEALRQMRARGLDFAAITDHGENLDSARRERDLDLWSATGEQVRAANDAALTDEGDSFLALRGFEWSSDVQGHCNVYDSHGYTGWRQTGDDTMRGFYSWLARAAESNADLLCGLNHPSSVERPFDDYAPARDYAGADLLDRLFVTGECFNRERDHGAGFFRLLDSGWHIAAAGGSDHHGSEWGAHSLPRTNLLARDLTPAGLREALRARRTFATRNTFLRLALTGNDEFMGARLSLRDDAPLSFAIYLDAAHAPAAPLADLRLETVDAAATNRAANTSDALLIELVTNGGASVARAKAGDAPRGVWRYEVAPDDSTSGERWYVARVSRGGEAIAYSSPVWARREGRR